LAFGFGKKKAIEQPSTEAGDRIYAIGDVHGRHDLLAELLERIEAHSAALPAPRNLHIIQLGDLIDRGPDSAKVLRYVQKVQQRTERFIVLQGNHEILMLRALAGETGLLRAWMRTGGRQTLESFGITPPERGADEAEAIAQIKRVLPAGLLDWLQRLPLTAQSGDYFFCHAGIRPGVSLKRQSRDDLLWIRDQFLEDTTPHPAVIVHGHTVTPEVDVRANRIGIDTGAYESGVLTALYLEGTRREFIATSPVSPQAGNATPAALAS
jgi:serine/threonine protein phosphatase 1